MSTSEQQQDDVAETQAKLRMEESDVKATDEEDHICAKLQQDHKTKYVVFQAVHLHQGRRKGQPVH